MIASCTKFQTLSDKSSIRTLLHSTTIVVTKQRKIKIFHAIFKSSFLQNKIKTKNASLWKISIRFSVNKRDNLSAHMRRFLWSRAWYDRSARIPLLKISPINFLLIACYFWVLMVQVRLNLFGYSRWRVLKICLSPLEIENDFKAKRICSMTNFSSRTMLFIFTKC